MFRKMSIIFIFFICVLSADNLNVDIKKKITTNKFKVHVIKQYALPHKGCVHINAQDAPVYVDTTSQNMVTIAIRISADEQFKKIKNILCKGKMIHDDILHISTKEQDIIKAYYISVPESANITVVSKGDIYATVPHACIEAKGRTVKTSFISATLAQVDETNRCYMQGLISNGKHFDYRPTIQLDTQGNITIKIARKGGLDYGSYLLTQLISKIKDSWDGLQELVNE